MTYKDKASYESPPPCIYRSIICSISPSFHLSITYGIYVIYTIQIMTFPSVYLYIHQTVSLYRSFYPSLYLVFSHPSFYLSTTYGISIYLQHTVFLSIYIIVCAIYMIYIIHSSSPYLNIHRAISLSHSFHPPLNPSFHLSIFASIYNIRNEPYINDKIQIVKSPFVHLNIHRSISLSIILSIIYGR